MLQGKFQDKNARMFQDKNVEMFPVNNAKMFQGKNVEMFQDRSKEKNAETSPGNSAITFLASNVKMFPVNSATTFPGSNVEMFLNKNVEMSPDSNVETCQDKFANKLVTVANNFFQSVYKNMEQSLVFITSPISIMLYQAYVIFILMSNFGLKHNLGI